jgi:hypothetical protein
VRHWLGRARGRSNHDMYSGGQGYSWLVDHIAQRASYYCLQNSDWQFRAMDTGHNDNNPITVFTNMTKLVTFGTWAEENWLLDKINLESERFGSRARERREVRAPVSKSLFRGQYLEPEDP